MNEDYGLPFDVEEDSSTKYEEDIYLGGAIEPLQKILPIIVGIIIITIIGLLAYSFFIGSQQKIEVSVKTIDGQLFKQNKLTVYDSQKNIVFEKKGQSSYVITLPNGNYFFEVNSSGYKQQTEYVTVDDKLKPFIILLRKDLDVDLQVFFPREITAGQKSSAQILMKNNSKKDVEIELEYNLTGILVLNNNKKIILQANSEKTLELELKAQTKKSREKEEGKIGIKLTKIEQSFSYKIIEAPDFDITQNIIFSGMEAVSSNGKNHQSKNIQITNNSNETLEGILLNFKIVSSKNNSKNDAIEWITFPKGITFEKIPPKSKITIPIEISLPSDAKSDTIKGKLIVSIFSIEQKKESNVEIRITKESTLSLMITTKKEFVINSTKKGQYEEIVSEIIVQNKGSIDVQNIAFTVENFKKCNLNWFEFTSNPALILKIEPNKTKKISFKVSAPKTAIAGQKKNCEISWRYINKITNNLVNKTKTITIIPK